MDVQILDKVQDLSDLELAMLLSLTGAQHAIVQTDQENLGDLEQELMLAARSTFGLSSTRLQCSSTTTLNDFSRGVLLEDETLQDSLHYSSGDGMVIPNVVVVCDLQETSHQVQMQALELLRTKRIFTQTAVHAAPKHFLLVFISSAESEPLVDHLRDHVFLSHTHDPEDGFPNLDEAAEASMSSDQVLKPLFGTHELKHLASMSTQTAITVEVMRYINDIVIFLRMHRAVAAGATPLATKHFISMAKCLGPLHNLGYVTPSLAMLAAKKVFRHRLVLVTPVTERSMQYGSDVVAVAALLEGMTPELVIDDVLSNVDCPL